MKVINKRGRDSAQYAYLLGFICHYILDSECHPYVEQMIEKTGVQHLEIEEEFENICLKKTGTHPSSPFGSQLVPTDVMTAKAIAPFYENITWKTVKITVLASLCEESVPRAEKLEERNHQYCHAADRTV